MYFWNFAKKIIREREYRTLIDELRLQIQTLRWNRKYKAFNDCYRNRQWNEAIQAGQTLLANGPVDPELYRKLANSYVKVNNPAQAKKKMKKAFKKIACMDKKELMQQLENTLFREALSVDSYFTYPGGSDNLGFIQHRVETQTGRADYLTKIIPTTYPLVHFAKKEQYFHEVVRFQSPILEQVTLELVGSLEMEKEHLLLLTFPKQADDGICRAHFKPLIQLNKAIRRSFHPEVVSELLEVTDRGKAPPLASLMHRRSTHLFIFQQIRNKLPALDQQAELAELTDRFERVIVHLALYERLHPVDDYVFCHGDFNGNNILYDQAADEYIVIDWCSYGLGLKGQDLAKMFASCRLPFTVIQREYMDLIFAGEDDEWRDKVFFVYQLFILWMERLDVDQVETQIQESLMPAAAYIEKIVKQAGFDV